MLIDIAHEEYCKNDPTPDTEGNLDGLCDRCREEEKELIASILENEKEKALAPGIKR